MYDLRFAPMALKYHDSSKPYLTFPDFSSLPFPTFDLSTELGLLASRMFPLNIKVPQHLFRLMLTYASL